MDRAGINAGQRVLDIGCGCSDSTLELARRVGPAGAVRGIDISAPLALAEQRAALEPALKLEFQQLDAQTANFSSDPFAHVFSRFGVMFFDDPVSAFGNILNALAVDGRVTFIYWRPLEENPWMGVPLGVTCEFVAPPEASPPDAPGHFQLADEDRARQILKAAGYADILLEALDEPFYLSGPGTAADATKMGPVARVLADSDEDTVQRVEAALVETLTPYYDGAGVRMDPACWIVSARAG